MGNIITHPTVFEKCLELLNLKNFRCPYSDTGAKKLLSGAAIAQKVIGYCGSRG